MKDKEVEDRIDKGIKEIGFRFDTAENEDFKPLCEALHNLVEARLKV